MNFSAKMADKVREGQHAAGFRLEVTLTDLV